jgi:hypothetical protein
MPGCNAQARVAAEKNIFAGQHVLSGSQGQFLF